jgi:dTDP-4-amino-4,6-dideoxygalactose transaminase
VAPASERPAVLGGSPSFPEGLAFARPFVPPLDRITERVRHSYERGILTNGPLVRQLEQESAERLGVDHVVAVSSCTAGLMLVLQALDLRGAVVMPSFTFSATAHAAMWNALTPRFAECEPASFQLDVDDAAGLLAQAGALMATHVFGSPCSAEQIEELAARAGVPVVFDAAHAFGARRGGRPVGGFGAAEVFSLSPTKIVVAGEGGLVATNRSDVAEWVRLGRDYGNPGDYDTQFAGLNARMSEFHAATALESMSMLDEHLERRSVRAERYRLVLGTVPGVRCQVVDVGDTSTYKDFTVAIDEAAFGLSRDVLRRALTADGVDTRCYFSPPVHRQSAYAAIAGDAMPVTDEVARSVISLPMFGELPLDAIGAIGELFATIHHHAEEIRDSAAA